MSFTRQLSEMSASELNDAIDDTNFPQAHILSRGRNNSICSTSSTSGTSSLMMDRNISQIDDILQQNNAANVVGAAAAAATTAAPTTPGNIDSDNQTIVAATNTTSTTTTTNANKSLSNRPLLILKSNGVMPEKDIENGSGSPTTITTPMTPRTSTTPGSLVLKFKTKRKQSIFKK